jgi:hypothetical protein
MNMFENSVGYVLVNQDRYDELLHKEALLDSVKKLHDGMSDYAFRDVVGHLLKTKAEVKADE